jgi:hypothetical protein
MEELKRGLFDIGLAEILKLYEHNINIYEIQPDEFVGVNFLNYFYEDLDTSLGYYPIEFSIFKEFYYNLKKKEKVKKKQSEGVEQHLNPPPNNISFLIFQLNPFIKKNNLLP